MTSLRTLGALDFALPPELEASATPEERGLRRDGVRLLVATIDDLASDDAVVCGDTGTAVIWMARYITAKQKRNIFGSLSWAAMANAMPNAIGAALAYPGRQVIAICGDGGLSMLLGDLLTIAERQLPVKLVVLDNSGFQFVHIEQEEAGIQPFGIKFANPDLAKVAESIGLTGIRVEDPSQIAPALKDALASDETVVVDVATDIDCRAPEPWLPST